MFCFCIYSSTTEEQFKGSLFRYIVSECTTFSIIDVEVLRDIVIDLCFDKHKVYSVSFKNQEFMFRTIDLCNKPSIYPNYCNPE